MLALFALFIVGALVEMYVLIEVGQAIGAFNTVAVLLLVSLVGVWLTKREGFLVLSRIREQVDAGRTPTNELIDGGLVLAGGLLLVVPGFVSDAFGLLLLFPPTRAVARALVRRRLNVTVVGRLGLPGADPRREPPDDVIDV